MNKSSYLLVYTGGREQNIKLSYIIKTSYISIKNKTFNKTFKRTPTTYCSISKKGPQPNDSI